MYVDMQVSNHSRTASQMGADSAEQQKSHESIK